jgi:hypothetical protein
MGYIHGRGLFMERSNRVGALAILVSGLLSIFFWVVLLSAAVDCGASLNRPTSSEELRGAANLELNLEWQVGVACFRIGLSSFMLSVVMTSYLAWQLLSAPQVPREEAAPQGGT